MSQRTFRVTSGGRIVHETIDEEVIIIDLESGAYYSLTQSGTELWSRLVDGATATQLTELLSAHYQADAAAIAAAVDAFLTQLVAEHIVETSTEPLAERGAAVPASATKRPFAPPQLSKYTNMSDLLLLDPIHDVDEHGWPHKKLD